MTQLGVILGTAAYMAPEQAGASRVDARADIWAFGCVLYEMLTGVRAFDGSETTDTMAAVLKLEPDWTHSREYAAGAGASRAAMPGERSSQTSAVDRRCPDRTGGGRHHTEGTVANSRIEKSRADVDGGCCRCRTGRDWTWCRLAEDARAAASRIAARRRGAPCWTRA
jgi:serine/threonine protein kinase